MQDSSFFYWNFVLAPPILNDTRTNAHTLRTSPHKSFGGLPLLIWRVCCVVQDTNWRTLTHGESSRILYKGGFCSLQVRKYIPFIIRVLLGKRKCFLVETVRLNCHKSSDERGELFSYIYNSFTLTQWTLHIGDGRIVEVRVLDCRWRSIQNYTFLENEDIFRFFKPLHTLSS